MDRPEEMTSSELEASQVFAAHLGGWCNGNDIAGKRAQAKAHHAHMRAGPAASPPRRPCGRLEAPHYV